MIPIKQTHEHYSGKSKESTGFKMAHSNKSFKILSSGLYSNKIKAVMREYMTNAYDAHADAGIVNTPFRVHLPTQIEPWFEVEDFGIGLSRDDVINIYTVFFTSTKVGDNDTNGCLGLGSKSAYAVSDQFTITAIKAGVKVAYSCYISREGFPTADLKHEVNTIESNGVTIRVPVSPKECYKWVNEWEVVVSPYEILPINNYEEDIYEDSGEVLRRYIKDARGNTLGVVDLSANTTFSGKCFALMGNVLYPIDTPAQYLRTSSLKGLYTQLESSTFILLNFNIGEVDIAPSREALSFDQTTTKHVQQKLTRLINKFYRDQIESVGGIDTNNYYQLFNKFSTTPLWDVLTELVYPFTGGNKLSVYEYNPYGRTNINKFYPLDKLGLSTGIGVLLPRIGDSVRVVYQGDITKIQHRRIRDLVSPSIIYNEGGCCKKITAPMKLLSVTLSEKGESPHVFHVTTEKDKNILQNYFGIDDKSVYNIKDYKVVTIPKERAKSKRTPVGKLEDTKVLCKYRTKDDCNVKYDVVDLTEGEVYYVDGDKFNVSLKKNWVTNYGLWHDRVSELMSFCCADKVVILNKTNKRKVEKAGIKPLNIVWKDTVGKVKTKLIKHHVWNGDAYFLTRSYNNLIAHKVKEIKRYTKIKNGYEEVVGFPKLSLNVLGLDETVIYNKEIARINKLKGVCIEGLKRVKTSLPLWEVLSYNGDKEDMEHYLRLEKIIK